MLLISLLAFIGLYPLMLGEIAGRMAGGLILTVIFVAGTMTASDSRIHRTISIALAVAALGLQVAWLSTHRTTVETIFVAMFAAFCLYTALVILRYVLAPGPVYAETVHAALSVYILLALFWAGAYALVEINSPGAFSLGAPSPDAQGHQGGRIFVCRHAPSEYRYVDIDWLRRHHARRSICALAEPTGAIGRGILYCGAHIASGRNELPVERWQWRQSHRSSMFHIHRFSDEHGAERARS